MSDFPQEQLQVCRRRNHLLHWVLFKYQTAIVVVCYVRKQSLKIYHNNENYSWCTITNTCLGCKPHWPWFTVTNCFHVPYKLTHLVSEHRKVCNSSMTFEAIINVECSSLYTAQDAKKKQGLLYCEKVLHVQPFQTLWLFWLTELRFAIWWNKKESKISHTMVQRIKNVKKNRALQTESSEKF